MKNKKELFVDLHIHSKYSRACSKALTFETLSKWAKIKGLDVLGTGDFTHPIWIEEVKKLRDGKNGFYYYEDFPFVVTGEVSLIYKHNEKTRKVHVVVVLPSVEIAEAVNKYFDDRGLRRDYDGRPIFKITCKDFVRDMRKISKDIEIIPAHVWTPWFGLFGSKGGYDSIVEAFGSQAKYINAIETGISSDIEMNSRVKELSGKTIMSFSDAHSFWPWRLGRECTIFRPFESYLEMLKQIRGNKIIGTVEVEPAYGMYHFDGHRNCDFSCSPAETRNLKGICPRCSKKLIVGVDNRVEELSVNGQRSTANGLRSTVHSVSLWKVLPLHEVISLWVGKGINTQAVWKYYNILIEKFGTEFKVLLRISAKELEKYIDKELVDLIIKNRRSEIKVKPGYDGVYGFAF
ncbi:MAG: endonuclease Q family protein [Nanoarchaeota archaeon]|jgi:uncharacterized protein (TIGR00375 family)|nr:endonuclease Q family protein [Nanoarchaeota archaeon]